MPRGDLDYAVGVGLRMLTLRRIVDEHDGLYRGESRRTGVLAYYANAIEPLVVGSARKRRPLEARRHDRPHAAGERGRAWQVDGAMLSAGIGRGLLGAARCPEFSMAARYRQGHRLPSYSSG